MQDTLEKLNSPSFEQYSEALDELRAAGDEAQNAPEADHVERICLVFEMYRAPEAFEDVHLLTKRVLDVLNKHEALLQGTQIEGVRTFAAGFLQRRYDGSGFLYVGGSVEMAAYVYLEQIVDRLAEPHPGEAEALARYRKLMRQVEGTHHVAYWILREIGARFLEVLDVVARRVDPQAQDMIFHALDGNLGDQKVIDFYKAHFQRVEQGWLKESIEEYLQHIEQ